MNSPLLADERVLKLLRSTQCAFPIQQDPWQDLATGIRCSREELIGIMKQLFAEKILLGISLETDVAHPAFDEWILPNHDSTKENSRWFVEGSTLSLQSIFRLKAQEEKPTFLEYAWPAVQWIKVGTFFEPAPSQDFSLREEMTERSFFVQPQAYSTIHPFDQDQLRILKSLSAPFIPNLAEPFWKSVGAQMGIPTLSVAREELSKVLLTKRVRRFRSILNPQALGYTACALAAWNLDADAAPRAGAALAKLRATADVCVRKPTQKFPFNLSALIFGKDENDLAATVQFIESKWSRSADFFLQGSFHGCR